MHLLAPELLALPGCGVLSAARLVAETGGASRFRSEAAFAMHVGVAPLPASSGNRTRYRLNRHGNRKLNATLHRIAITQLRICECARVFVSRKRQEGRPHAKHYAASSVIWPVVFLPFWRLSAASNGSNAGLIELVVAWA